jgi:hypothetical protein
VAGVNNVCFFLNLNNLMSLIGTERKLDLAIDRL